MNKWLLSKKQVVVCSTLTLLESSRTKILRPHPPGEMPYGIDGVKSAECPTNVKEVVARFAQDSISPWATPHWAHRSMVWMLRDRRVGSSCSRLTQASRLHSTFCPSHNRQKSANVVTA